MLILPPSDRESKHQCSKSRLWWVNSIEKLALNVFIKACVIQIPKYLNFCALTLNGNKPKSVCLAAVLTGIILLFCRLILYPNILPNSSSRFRVFDRLVEGWDRYKNISLAYRDTLSFKSYLCIPFVLASPHKASGSIAIANSRGDGGKPCQVPRWRGKSCLPQKFNQHQFAYKVNSRCHSHRPPHCCEPQRGVGELCQDAVCRF